MSNPTGEAAKPSRINRILSCARDGYKGVFLDFSKKRFFGKGIMILKLGKLCVI